MNSKVAHCFVDVDSVRTPKRKMCEIIVKKWHPFVLGERETNQALLPCSAALRFLAANYNRCIQVRICHVINGKNECQMFSCKQARKHLVQEYPQD